MSKAELTKRRNLSSQRENRTTRRKNLVVFVYYQWVIVCWRGHCVKRGHQLAAFEAASGLRAVMA